MKPTEEQVYEAIKKILDDEYAGHKKSLNYAIGYCRQGLELTGEALRVQCLYILNNITHWRHVDAKRVRQILKDYSK